jgi:polysaccharide pyruvyl transferase WcaK-like protein
LTQFDRGSGGRVQIASGYVRQRGDSKKVALTGYYGRGNFGDDLMAILFGLSLRELGADFVIYRLNREYAQQFNFKIETDPGELLRDAGILLWGGGGLLVPWSAFTYGLLFRGISREYAALVETAQHLGLRFCAASVGGSGDFAANLTPGYKQSFLNSAEYISVRNPQDLALLDRNGVRGDYFPDVVWQTAERFPVTRARGEGTRIGIDLYFSNLARKRALYILPLLWRITRMRRDCEFIIMDSTNARVRPYRGLGRLIRGRNVRNYQFRNLTADLEFLASLDLLISSRLHTTMVCMGYGVPVLSLFGEKKTALMMKNLNLASCSLDHDQIRYFVSLLTQSGQLTDFLAQFQFPDVARLRSESHGHQERLTALLESVRP